jgi:hypothetical protein
MSRRSVWSLVDGSVPRRSSIHRNAASTFSSLSPDSALPLSMDNAESDEGDLAEIGPHLALVVRR